MTKYTLYYSSAWLFPGAARSYLLRFRGGLVWVFGLPALLLEPPRQAWPHQLRAVVEDASGQLLIGLLVVGVANAALQWGAVRARQP